MRTEATGLRVTLDGAPNGAPAWLMVGPASSTSWRGLSLPAPLDPFGLPGCSRLAPPDLVFDRVTGISGWDAGYAAVSAPVTATTQGFGVAAQWLSLMPGTGCFAMSPRHSFTVR